MMDDYLRVTPISERLGPDAITDELGSLRKLREQTGGLLDRANPLESNQPPTFGFLALSEGANEPVEFCYGADEHLDVLAERLRSIYPDSFDITPVELDPLKRLIRPIEYEPDEYAERLASDRIYSPNECSDDLQSCAQPDSNAEVMLARPSLDETTPHGISWRGTVDRRKDWMTTLTGLSERLGHSRQGPGTGDGHTRQAPLAPLIDKLTTSAQPLLFQVIFQRKPDWSKQARRRSGSLLTETDTLLQKVLSLESSCPGNRTHRGREESWTHTPKGVFRSGRNMRDRERDENDVTRLDHIRSNTPERTFQVSIRLLALTLDDAIPDELDYLFETLSSTFDPLDGPYYQIGGQRIRDKQLLSGLSNRRAETELEWVRSGSVATRDRDRMPRLTNRADSRPDLILNPDELANFVVVPSSSDLSVEGARGTRAEQQSRNPLPRPNQDISEQLREPGLELGYLLDENREPEDDPLRLPPDLLPFHVGRFAKTGAGKSVALINVALSLYDQTSGPVILIDTKGGGLPEHYMSSHARRFGFEDLEDAVTRFDIQDQLPGFAFFNFEAALANGVPRT